MERKLDEKYYVNSFDEESGIYNKKDHILLLVIDEQPRLMNALENGENTVLNTITLIEASQKYQIPVLATEQYPKGLGNTDERILAKLDKNNIYEKTIFDAATAEVLDFIEKNNIKKVVIAGAEAHICVYQTTRSLLNLGINVFLPKDALASFKESQKEEALKTLREMGAVRTETETLLFDLARDSKDPNFKFISGLIKDMRDR
ncbi:MULTISPECIES: isochorismatase family protein [Anaerococcus]|jgi:isochorismatase hydrolase|uniref:Isochorismatase family n=1 Tax=Anaerococcus octavius TaxID=54007 RepID=A0A380WVJ6_9FIRM|nr:MULTISPECIES: isochorismatase family protein [Anaerococcus]MDU2132999.1 isochorismatase family protein [Finegoldia magna]MBS6105442.1 isochorismatase family protein [Anaerococcus sp.]MDU2598863.1 isochorismatase family protein [Anaerococcus sp.]MDU3177367.1 isochorismatase family protein [Anaerococcus sp.]MDU4025095.1 isochorismatase family protein [Anaerococcus sp.]